jgi:hypothetical protein
MKWKEGSPLAAEWSAKDRPWFLLEFDHGDRFVVIEFNEEGFMNMEDGGLISDRPISHCQIPKSTHKFHVDSDQGTIIPFAKECTDAIEAALKEFGSYSYNDKGADSVIDMKPFVKRFKAMDPHEAALVLEEVLRHDDGYSFASDIVQYVDGTGKWFEKLMESDALRDLY